MADRVTIQDIADSLGISRTTVSKAINNTGVLAGSTKEKVIKRAVEMGYKQFSNIALNDSDRLELNLPHFTEAKEISLFTTVFLSNHQFASKVLDTFQRELVQSGCYLTIHRILDEEIDNLKLPPSFVKENSTGIICFEMFDHEYSRMICDLNIPTLFVDSPVRGLHEPLKSDCLYMDNQTQIFAFVKEMVRIGRKKIGFIGEYMHCQSFFERYMAYKNAMHLLELQCPEEYCIIGNKKDSQNPSSTDYQEYLAEHIRRINELPDVFICANDSVAIDVLQVLKELGISVPDDMYLCGFDDSSESQTVAPSLTTIHIHSRIIANTAIHLLASRINDPSLNYRTVYTETDLIYRESTGQFTNRKPAAGNLSAYDRIINETGH